MQTPNVPPPRSPFQESPGGPGGRPPPKGLGPGDGEWRIPAIITAAFCLGIGAGVLFTEDVNLYPNNVASTELVDRRTPNSEVCMANGYSAMVFDQRLFVSFNPYVPTLFADTRNHTNYFSRGHHCVVSSSQLNLEVAQKACTCFHKRQCRFAPVEISALTSIFKALYVQCTAFCTCVYLTSAP